MTLDTSPRAGLRTALGALAALLAGVLLGLVLLAGQAALPGIDPGSPLAKAGELIVPVAGLGLVVAVSLYNPLAAMLIWLVLAPYSTHIPLDISLGAGVPDISLSRLMAGWLGLLVLLQAALGKRRLRPLTWSDLAYVLFAVGMLAGVSQSRIGPTIAVQAIFDAYLVPFVALLLARQLVRNRRDLDWITAALLVIGAGLAFLIVREQVTGEILLNATAVPAAYSRSFRKIQSLLGNAAPMGVTAAMTLPLGLMALVRAVDGRRSAGARWWPAVALLVAANALIALGVFMTYNRMSWLGAALALIVLAVLRPRARRLLLPLLLLAAILLLLFWQGVSGSAAVNERLLEDNSIDYRATAADLALRMVRSSPVFGIGYNNFGYEAATTYGYDPVESLTAYPPAHNSYLFIVVSGGLFALLPYLAWLALVAWGGLRRYLLTSRLPRSALLQSHRDALAAGIALFLIYVLASGTFDNAQTGYMNLVFYAALGAIWGATEDAPVERRTRGA